jgi:hypothetical protein
VLKEHLQYTGILTIKPSPGKDHAVPFADAAKARCGDRVRPEFPVAGLHVLVAVSKQDLLRYGAS